MIKTPLRVHVLAALAVGVLASIAYYPVLGSPFLADDFMIIRKLALSEGGTNWGQVLADFHGPWMGADSRPFYRPLNTLLFGIDHFLYGTNPLGYHMSNLALNIVSAFLVYLTTLELVAGNRRHEVALTAGAIFSIYPIHPESVSWIAGRVDVVCSVFYLLTLLFFLRWLHTEGKFHLSLSLIFLVMSIMSKEAALGLPGLLFLCALYKKRNIKDALVKMVPSALVFGACLLLRSSFLPGASFNKFEQSLGVNQIEASLIGLLYWTMHSLIPINLGLLPDRWSDVLNSVFLFWPIPIVVVGLFLVASGRHRSFLLLCLGLYFVSLIPVFEGLRPQPELIKARYLYIPSIFLSIVIAYVLWSVIIRRVTVNLAATVLVCGGFFAILIVNNGAWVQAGEMSREIQRSGDMPEAFPVRYEGAHVFLTEGQVRAANAVPFNEQSSLSQR
jgi:protein O-mannosyl-transferase